MRHTYILFFLLSALSCLAADNEAPPDPVAIALGQMKGTVAAYFHEGQYKGFYGYSSAPADDVDPDIINIPTNAWPVLDKNGLKDFLDALIRLEKAVSSPEANTPERILTDVCRLFTTYPLLQYQAFCKENGEPDQDETFYRKNNVFLQYLSRRLLFLAMHALPAMDSDNAKKGKALLLNSYYPRSANGQAGARLFSEHGIVYVGFGVGKDDAWISQEFLQIADEVFSCFPPHFFSGNEERGPLNCITAHGSCYIKEMSVFAEKYFSQYSNARSWLGYLHGMNLNTFSPGSAGNIRAQAPRTLRYPAKTLSGKRVYIVPVKAYSALNIFTHEVMHYIHSTVRISRPDYEQRLISILDYGNEEQADLLAIAGNNENYAKTGVPPYAWAKKYRQESLAHLIPQIFADPVRVLEWTVNIAVARDRKLEPLNRLLWLVDAFSLDSQFKETNVSFIPTMQTGSDVVLMPLRFTLARDAKGRISRLDWNSGFVQLGYEEDIAYVIACNFVKDKGGSQQAQEIDIRNLNRFQNVGTGKLTVGTGGVQVEQFDELAGWHGPEALANNIRIGGDLELRASFGLQIKGKQLGRIRVTLVLDDESDLHLEIGSYHAGVPENSVTLKHGEEVIYDSGLIRKDPGFDKREFWIRRKKDQLSLYVDGKELASINNMSTADVIQVAVALEKYSTYPQPERLLVQSLILRSTP